MLKEDLKNAWKKSVPVFVGVGKCFALTLGVTLWVLLNVLLSDSVAAVLSLWAVTAVCVIVWFNYVQAVYERKQEEKVASYYAKRDADWLARFGYPYPK